MKKKNVKHFILILAAVVLITSCKKDQQASANFRDALAGNYACTVITVNSSIGGSIADTTRDTIQVAKSTLTDSAILIGSYTFNFYGSSQSSYQFNGPVTNAVSCTNIASFATNGSSLYWQSACQQNSTSSYTIAQGIKIQ